MSCKITIIGAGSAVFTSGIVEEICRSPHLHGTRLCLMDINRERLEMSLGFANRLAAELSVDIRIEATTDRKSALKGADYVVNTALVIGVKKFWEGCEVAKKHGYNFGGSQHIMHDEAFYINFYQLRLMEEIMVDILDICPDAYYIMAANPVLAGVTYLGRKYPQAKLVGVCPGYHHLQDLTKALGYEWDDIDFDFAGINHFIWLKKLYHKSVDVTARIAEWLDDGWSEHAKTLRYCTLTGPKFMDIYKRFGMYPICDTAAAGGGAWSWQYHVDAETNKRFNEDPEAWWNLYFGSCDRHAEFMKQVAKDMSVKVSDDVFPKVYDPIVEIIEGIEADLSNTVVVNVMNDGGYMTGLPTDWQTEIKATVDKNGIHPIPNDGLPKPIMAMMMRDRLAPVEMELAAFAERSKGYLTELIMMDPWTRSREQAEGFIDAIFELPWNREMKEYYS